MRIVRELRLMADSTDDRAIGAMLARAASVIEGQNALITVLHARDDHAASAALMSAQHSIGGLDE